MKSSEQEALLAANRMDVEVARIAGYDALPATPLPEVARSANGVLTVRQGRARTARRALAAAGVDLLWLETQLDLREARAALAAPPAGSGTPPADPDAIRSKGS